MTGLKLKKPIKTIFFCLISIIVYFLSLNLALQVFLPRIVSKIHKNAKNFVTYKEIKLRLFPYPGVKITNLNIKKEQLIDLNINSADIIINFLGIPDKFLGIRVSHGTVILYNLKLSPEKNNKPFTIPEIPIEFIDLVNIDIKTTINKRPVIFQNTNTSILLNKDNIHIKCSGKSNISKEVTLSSTISNSEKKIKAHVVDLDLGKLLKILPQKYVFLKDLSGQISSDIQIDIKNQKIIADIHTTSKEMGISGKIKGLDSQIALKIDTNKKSSTINIKKLTTTYPYIDLSGNIEISKNKIITQIASQKINLSQVIEFYKKFPIKNSIADHVLSIVKGGELYNSTFTMIHKNHNTNWELTGACKNTDIIIPHIELPLKKVSGEIKIKDNILECRNVGGYYKNSKILNGYLDLGLNSQLKPFIIKTNVEFDLKDLTPLLKKINVSKRIINELGKIKINAGNCSGLFTLNKNLDQYLWKVITKNIKANGKIDKTPFDIATHLFTITGDNIYLKGGNIKLKRSHLKDIEVDSDLRSKDFKLSLQNSKINIKELKDEFKYLFNYSDRFNVIGDLFLKKLNIHYNYSEKKLKDYLLNGSISNLKVKNLNPGKDLPKDINISISGGNFSVYPERLKFVSSNIDALNSKIKLNDLELSGNFKNPRSIKIDFSGDISRKIQNIIKKMVPQLKLVKTNNNIHVNKMKINSSGKNVTINGQVILNGILTNLKVEKNPIKLFTAIGLIYKNSRCNVLFNKQKRDFSLKFKGELTKNIVDRLINENSYLKGKISGDFSLRFSLNPFYIINSNGYIKINSLFIDPSSNLSVIQLSANSFNNMIVIEKSLISLFKDKINAYGKINLVKDHNNIDIALKSDKLHLDPIINKFHKKQEKKVQLKLKGTIYFKIKNTFYKKRVITDLGGQIFIDNGFKFLKVSRGYLCNLPIMARVQKKEKYNKLDIWINSSYFPIQDTLTCLISNKNKLITGTSKLKLDLHSNLDSKNNFIKTLNGKFIFDSKDGRIFKLTLISQILTIINSTEIFFGKVPDLEKTGFKYNNLQAIGEIKKGTIIFKKSFINGTNMELAFHGKIDLNTKKVDLIVLFAPLKTVDRIIKKIPILKNITGGNLLVIPFQAKGKINDPMIIPLSPKAVGAEAMGILKNTIKLPFTIFQPLLPNKN